MAKYITEIAPVKSKDAKIHFTNDTIAKPNRSNNVRVYKQDDQVKLIQSVASYSTMASSFAAEAKDYILSLFPKDYFRYINIDTANVRSMLNMNKNFNNKVNKIPYPSLNISPELVMENPSDSMTTNPIISSPDLYLMKDMNDYYYKLLFDPDKKISMYYTCDYVTMNFNIKIAVRSFIQNANITRFILNKCHMGLERYLHTKYLSTEIPKTFIATLAYLFNYDLNNSQDMEELETYLIQTTQLGINRDVIKKKLNLATGKTCFFLNDATDMIIILDDLDAPSSIIREGQAEGEYLITFRVQLSALVANNFILSVDKSKFRKLGDNVEFMAQLRKISDDDVEESLQSIQISQPLRMNKVPSLTFTDSTGEEHIGQNIVNETITYPIDENEIHLNLIPLLKSSVLETQSYMVSNNIDVSSLLNVRVADKNGTLTDENLSINYDTMEVDISNPQSDLGLNIYLDRATFEAINNARSEDKPYWSDNFLATLTVNIEDENGILHQKKAIVKSFADEKEEYSEDIDKQLRVNTIYGVGYVYIVNEDDPNASDLKICMGTDKYGNYIIKSFVLKEE